MTTDGPQTSGIPHDPTTATAAPAEVPILIRPGSGLAGLPALATVYRAETQLGAGESWQPHNTESQEHVLDGIEFLLRRGLATAHAEGTMLVVTVPLCQTGLDQDEPQLDAAPRSRYVPLGQP
ncbi:hypothetical protein OG730_42320 (plasmid) [Streptomyces sp. NBC_01298]|uniref:hypothetical protein n=1 Tax=Streptomyces sp. NBC_01298 TaxID=2903817 RepID=UPI002E126EA2|nr:hypothetical protein OG730_42320 [Streptomyces sp. NBC_01298]